MAGQDWSITITPSGSIAAFNPNPQQAQNSDLVAWNNRTGETHQPWQLGADGQPIPEADITKGSAGCTYLSDPIDPWSSSYVYDFVSDLKGSTASTHLELHGASVYGADDHILDPKLSTDSDDPKAALLYHLFGDASGYQERVSSSGT